MAFYGFYEYCVRSIIFFIVTLLLAEKGLEDKIDDNYYKRRVKEIFQKKYNGQDIWVSRWELDGIMDYIENSADAHGKKLFEYHEFEHGKKAPSVHPLGKQKMLHVHVHLTDKYGNDIKRHLLITNDPYDSRLSYIGLEEHVGGSIDNPAKKTKSSVYDPMHPRHEKGIYKRNIRLSYERGN